MRGIRLCKGSGAVVEDCRVELLEVVGSGSAITVHTEMNAATIRNTEIRIDTDNIAAILAKHPEHTGDDQGLRCENVSITGSAAYPTAMQMEGRDDCVFDRMAIHQPGRNRDGIVLVNSEGSVVRDSTVSVTDVPIVATESTVRD